MTELDELDARGCLFIAIITAILLVLLMVIFAKLQGDCKPNEELVRKLNGTYHCAVVR